MDKENYEALLKEYEVSQAFSTQMGNQVWQTASIFIALSLAGIALLAEGNGHSWARLSVISVIGLASIAILALWGGILRRWTSFDRIAQYRMREIEGELGMWKNRYIDLMDSTLPVEQKSGASSADMVRTAQLERLLDAYRKSYGNEDGDPDAETNQRLTRLFDAHDSVHSRRGGGKAVMWIRRLLMLGWLAMIIQEAVFTFLQC